jgi:hypothetical protein
MDDRTRRLFRIWAILSVLWVAGCAGFALVNVFPRNACWSVIAVSAAPDAPADAKAEVARLNEALPRQTLCPTGDAPDMAALDALASAGRIDRAAVRLPEPRGWSPALSSETDIVPGPRISRSAIADRAVQRWRGAWLEKWAQPLAAAALGVPFLFLAMITASLRRRGSGHFRR